MQDSSLSLALAKVVAVAAWADGEVAPEERDCLMDLLYQLPGLSLKDWRRVQKLLDRPVSPASRSRYMKQLVEQVKDDNAKIFALYALERMVEADGVIADSERGMIAEFIDKVGAFPLDALNLLLQVLEQPMERRIKAANRTEREFAPVDEVIAERIDDWMQGEFGLEDRTKTELRRLCLAGILLARVIHADDYIDERELAVAIDFLMSNWKLEREQAEFIMIVSLSDAFNELDVLRVSRWLFEETNLRERRRFLELLFEIAIIDGELLDSEVDEIMQICANLRLDHLDFQRHYERVSEMAG
ncbi:TerB family tellurite resistance protein [Cerasicoccus arenae]|uniref:Co-chaperone DjlA N-terminal domain-containing protein n=1 Tax=Cerasicoccus arenae TaxID=424488 RepID=A0A8J3DGT2_9BACT|nr:TerB family tellurite resistance protein [Cerasicoccus arenae]MBK1857741.1 TerB family tellurite resistance protein [Cerasicoccus arenae]GHB91075.1 hypothetical protein GCM10007047_02490 [Cerasicoccus arenae]